mmetsp:Transcript_811/g.1790  ORF Transcript_811/g.1790 Transcript_811/m.1790 type:complete len:167 (+) Transcript_811:206-706(+)
MTAFKIMTVGIKRLKSPYPMIQKGPQEEEQLSVRVHAHWTGRGFSTLLPAKGTKILYSASLFQILRRIVHLGEGIDVENATGTRYALEVLECGQKRAIGLQMSKLDRYTSVPPQRQRDAKAGTEKIRGLDVGGDIKIDCAVCALRATINDSTYVKNVQMMLPERFK